MSPPLPPTPVPGVPEYVLWGRRPDDPEWAETILTATTDKARIEAIKARAAADGWIDLRVSTFHPGGPVDFAGTVNV